MWNVQSVIIDVYSIIVNSGLYDVGSETGGLTVSVLVSVLVSVYLCWSNSKVVPQPNWAPDSSLISFSMQANPFSQTSEKYIFKYLSAPLIGPTIGSN